MPMQPQWNLNGTPVGSQWRALPLSTRSRMPASRAGYRSRREQRERLGQHLVPIEFIQMLEKAAQSFLEAEAYLS